MKTKVGKSVLKKLCYVVALTMVVSIVSVMSFIPVSAAGANILVGINADFEAGGWAVGTCDAITTDPGQGTTSASVINWTGKFISSIPLLKENTNYEINCLVKTIAPGNNLNVGVIFNDNTTATNESATIAYTGNDTAWTRIKKIFKTGFGIAKVDAFNNIAVTMWSASTILIDDIQLIEIGQGTPTPLPTATPAPTPVPTPTPIPTPTPVPIPLADTVTINAANDKILSISGNTTPAGTSLYLSYGSVVNKTVVSNGSGIWKVVLVKALTPGSKITAMCNETKTITVAAAMIPVVKTVTTKSKTIMGTTYKNGAVTMKVGTKTYTMKASVTGAFKKVLSKTLKKGTKITVRTKTNGVYSPTKTLLVK